eukprot:TRINITY_DN77829_c0_g1_i1.p1 TRINITY_DN77829_c0_g1~~TRINITY_DN77829_c0_g1_i1.p1  ORF type:complete len:201 (+),score=45.07 TRINITY_DN77829_c0_g1_i1:29-604(+)
MKRGWLATLCYALAAISFVRSGRSFAIPGANKALSERRLFDHGKVVQTTTPEWCMLSRQTENDDYQPGWWAGLALLLLVMCPTSVRAESSEQADDFKDLVERTRDRAFIDAKQYARAPEYIKEWDRQAKRAPIVPFKSRNLENLTGESLRLAEEKEARRKRNYDMAAAIHPDDGWKMKLQGSPFGAVSQSR